MQTPRHRFLAIEKTKQRLPDWQPGSLEAELYAALHGEKANASVVKALDIFRHEYKRETLEAALLSGMSSKEIEDLLRVDAQIVDAYRYLFFDTSVFENRLDEIDYAYTYQESVFGRDLKKLAVDLGKDCLRVRLANNEASDIPAAKIVESVRKIAFLSINMVRTDRSNTELSNFAQRWATLGLKTADSKQENTNNSLETLRLALEGVEHKQPEIDPDQILH